VGRSFSRTDGVFEKNTAHADLSFSAPAMDVASKLAVIYRQEIALETRRRLGCTRPGPSNRKVNYELRPGETAFQNRRISDR
jgi:hypothetical protein